MQLEREENGYVVRVTALPAALEQGIEEGELSAELMNYALGKTIERALAEGSAAEIGKESK